jgi:3D (Asp-Asp-Asp) domain-containing protein
MNKQAMKDILIFWLGLIGCILVIGYYMVVKVSADIEAVKSDIAVIQDLQQQVEDLKEEIKSLEDAQKHNTAVKFEKVESESIDISRGNEKAEPLQMRVTAYDLSYQSCKKNPDHPEYGITASGVKVKEHHTIAAGPELPFGTKVFIPALADKPNGGVFTVEDRGSAIKENCLDIYMPSNKECMDFGVKELEVYILN